MPNTEIPSDIVYAIAVSPEFSKDQTCFSARQSGLYRSSDGGKSWQDAYLSLGLAAPMPTQAVAFSPDFSKDRTLFAAVQGGMLRSRDAGASWQVDLLPNPPPMASNLVVSPNYPQDGQAFFSTMEDGVFCTRDRGLHWNTWNFGLLDFQTLCLAISPAFAKDETLIAGAETGIFISKNGGRAWKTSSFPADAAPVTGLAFSPAYETDGLLFSGSVNGGLFRSNDRGKSWTLIHQFEDGIDQILLGKDFAQAPEILILSGSVLYYSQNGAFWTMRPVELADEDSITCLAAPFGIGAESPLLVGTLLKGILIG